MVIKVSFKQVSFHQKLSIAIQEVFKNGIFWFHVKATNEYIIFQNFVKWYVIYVNAL